MIRKLMMMIMTIFINIGQKTSKRDTCATRQKIRFWAKKIFFLKIEEKNARTKTKVSLDWNGQKLFRTIEKT